MRFPPATVLLLASLLLACSGENPCGEGLEAFGEPPPRGFELTCKRKGADGKWVQHGPQTRWHLNGKKAVETTWKEGKQDGVRTEWDQQGRKTKTTPYAAGVVHGDAVEWDAAAEKKRSTTPYSKGKRHGTATEWYPSGEKRSETRYDNDKLAGPPRRWYETGLLIGEMEWVRLPGGTFRMGAKDERTNQPRKATVGPFEIARTEVTVDQYQRCVDARACALPKTGPICNWGQPGRGAHPVNCVDWHQANAFATWAKVRLLSDPEWEYAARSGGRDQLYPWGPEPATCARAILGDGGDGCGENRTWPACSKSKGHSAQGVCDLAGNVYEWTADAKKNRRSRYLRGGSFNSVARQLRSSSRRAVKESMRTPILGFRVARDVKP